MNLDTRPCYKCDERRLLCHAECERYAAYKRDLDAFNAAMKKEAAGVTKKRWKKCCGKWVKVR